MFRFFVSKKIGNFFELSPETLHHLKVARVTEDFICIYQKLFYRCKLVDSQALIEEQLTFNHEFKGDVVVAVSLIKIKRFEWLIQKAAELGATKLIPMISTYVNVKSYEWEDKITRWQTISQNACQQAFRNQVMEVTKPQNFHEVVTLKFKHKFLAHEKTNNSVISKVPTNCLLLIGPEGGFTQQEVNIAINHECQIISLGLRILRTETAALFLLSNVRD